MMFVLIAPDADIKLFYFLSGPGRFAQKREAGLDAGVEPEAPDVNDTTQVFPPKMFNKLGHDHFQRFSVKRIF
jgi:hypothetical protein